MARAVKAGSWVYRISDNQRELQKSPVGTNSYSYIWSAPNGELILDLDAMGEEVCIYTDRHMYVRHKNSEKLLLLLGIPACHKGD